MDHRHISDGIFSSDSSAGLCSTRRGLLLAPLLAALPIALSDTAALADRINASETQVTLPDAIKWSGWINGFPPHRRSTAAWTSPGPILC
jgi:hypothetical protein